MPLEILENKKQTITYDYIRKNYRDIIKTLQPHTEVLIDMFIYNGHFPFYQHIIETCNTIYAKIIEVNIETGILLEFPDNTIKGHSGNLQDGSSNKWYA